MLLFFWGGGSVQTGFCCVALAVLEPTQTQRSACLCLLSAGIKGVCHHCVTLFIYLFLTNREGITLFVLMGCHMTYTHINKVKILN